MALKAPILIEIAASWEGRAFRIRQAFVMRPPFRGGTQEADMTGLINHAEVVDRMTLLIAAVAVLSVLWLGRAVNRSLSTILPRRGEHRDTLGPFGRRYPCSIVTVSTRRQISMY